MTLREAVYMVLDELKLISDDSDFNEDHVIFLLSKYRAMILNQRYADIKKQIPSSNYQTLCLDLEQVPAIDGSPCTGGLYLKSKFKIPSLMTIGTTMVYPLDYYQGTITFVSKERMRYVGYNKYLQNIIYCSLGPDNFLYFKSSNPQFLYLQKVRLTGIFQELISDPKLLCGEDSKICDILDTEFPLEEALIPQLIQSVVKELAGAIYKPSDNTNNAKDDLSDLMSFIQRNTKSNLQKQMES